ncbi:hypothetical protein A2G24_01115 [Listeria monocytogenes]|uniref:Uncharacterized protein n=1 Tax=Listeria monocytogenes TaxID=1639 RepID=A0A823DFU7_LISMN|nr:hypothetical protein [Listeria monocytogenes]EAD1012227.1 hypothetical protein [Listeria monocytogenes]EAD1186134.1 hypothetical protein [Listeria monocytogenes]EAF8898052.1 hypothetical protein [Listeria monocytogenes]
MTKEELEFLKNLQEELNEQPSDGNADPVFWVVGDYQWELAPDGYEEDYRVYASDGDEFSLSGFLEYLTETGDYDEVLSEVNSYDSDYEHAEKIIDFLDYNAGNVDGFRLVGVLERHIVEPNTFFITKEEAKRHIQANRHHYTSKVHTYAMTAWRSPVVGRLWKVLRTCDFDKLEDAAHEQ